MPRLKALTPFPAIRDHVLLPWATKLADADAKLGPLLTRAVLEEILARVPDEWLVAPGPFTTAALARAAYLDFFERRLARSSLFVEEADRARTQRV